MVNINARRLRQNATDAERRLWSALRARRHADYRFRRQHPVCGFILDFACTKYRVAIEADGSQHADNPTDKVRSAVLEREGWRILRFWNNDILSKTEGVIDAILRVLNEQHALTRSRAMPATTLSRDAGEGMGTAE